MIKKRLINLVFYAFWLGVITVLSAVIGFQNASAWFLFASIFSWALSAIVVIVTYRQLRDDADMPIIVESLRRRI